MTGMSARKIRWEILAVHRKIVHCLAKLRFERNDLSMHRIPQKLSLVSQTAAILTERIQAGEWHHWLPGEHELCAQLHIARMTLRRALQQLQRNGLIRSSQGKPREIVARRKTISPKASGRVLLLTQVPMQTRLPFDAFWTHELREALEKAGYHLEFHSNHASYGRVMTTNLERLQEQLRPVGWVLTNSTQAMQRWFDKRRLPCVIVGSRHPGVELPFVDKAYRAMCRHAVGMFLARGHTRFVLLNPESGAAGDLESEQGFREGVTRSNRQDIQASVVRHDGTVADVQHKLSALIRRREPPTAILVSRAAHVLTVMGQLLRGGLRIPEDVAIIARDHEWFLEAMVPSVTSYVQNSDTMAKRISSAVLEMLESGMVSPANCQIMPEFKERETLGPHAPRPRLAAKPPGEHGLPPVVR